MIDPRNVCLYIPTEHGKSKRALFDRIGEKVRAAGGRTIVGNTRALIDLPDDIIPIVGAAPYLYPIVKSWRERGRKWIGWDRGYFRRVYATWLPRGEAGGYYRWTINAYQMRSIRDVPDDRWKAMRTDVLPWRRGGRHIVIAAGSRTYAASHGCESWIADTIDALARVTDRQLIIRDKESRRPLQADLDGAHALVAHGSIAAVEAVVLGTPVFVHPDSAAALVGKTDLKQIEHPVYPERLPWLKSLAYSQFSEQELCDGTLWRLIS